MSSRSNQNRIKVAVVGMGKRAIWATQTLRDNDATEIVGLVDPVVEIAEFFRDKYSLGDCKCAFSLDSILEDCDAVVVTSPDKTHADVAVPILEAGRYVYLEKPLDITLANCQRIIDADTAAGGKVFVGHNLRYAPVYSKAFELIRGGVIGDITTIEANEHYKEGCTYFERWNAFRAEGGGLWITKATHDFDVLNWFTGKKPISVTANAHLTYFDGKPGAAEYCPECQYENNCPEAYPGPFRLPEQFRELAEELYARGLGPRPGRCLFNTDTDTFDHGSVRVNYPDGVIATYTVNVISAHNERRIFIAGTKGSIDGSIMERHLTLRRRGGSDPEEMDLSGGPVDQHGGADTYVFRQFLEFVRGEDSTRCSPYEAALAVHTGLAARQSCDEGGKPINLNEVK